MTLKGLGHEIELKFFDRNEKFKVFIKKLCICHFPISSGEKSLNNTLQYCFIVTSFRFQ
jgi:hypothetical protein